MVSLKLLLKDSSNKELSKIFRMSENFELKCKIVKELKRRANQEAY